MNLCQWQRRFWNLRIQEKQKSKYCLLNETIFSSDQTVSYRLTAKLWQKEFCSGGNL